jgi:hypothetical protein
MSIIFPHSFTPLLPVCLWMYVLCMLNTPSDDFPSLLLSVLATLVCVIT